MTIFHPDKSDIPSEIVYLPVGTWNICPRVNGKAKWIKLKVDKFSASVLQKSLEQRLAQPVGPVGGFDHKPGPVSLVPKEFYWVTSLGVMLKVQWTSRGLDALISRAYTHFAPTFLLAAGEIKGLTSRGEIGSLINNPVREDWPCIELFKYN